MMTCGRSLPLLGDALAQLSEPLDVMDGAYLAVGGLGGSLEVLGPEAAPLLMVPFPRTVRFGPPPKSCALTSDR